MDTGRSVLLNELKELYGYSINNIVGKPVNEV